MRITGLFVFATVLYLTGFAVALAQRTGAFAESLNHPAILYSTTAANTVVDELNRRLADGSASLTFDEQSGYLKSVLDLLKVPVESQVLVYSPTSQQAEKITPQNPRAIYFNDNVSVGYVRGGGILEVVAQDAKLGSVFYVIHQQAGARNLGREQQCLRCHLSWDTLGVPGMSVLSTFPRKTKDDYANGFSVDHFRPIGERWGGWYVTGTRVPARHMGNFPLFMPNLPQEGKQLPPPARPSMDGQIDLTSYPTPYSDIVALMVLEHQAHAANLITRLNWEARLNQPSRVTEAVETLVDYLLFVDEAPIPSGGIEGSSGFAEKFQTLGPRDSKGRSLRDLNLKTRLAKYPLSYMIYSPAFAALPPAAKEMAMDRIKRVLSGEITGAKYAHLTPATRQAIAEILSGTSGLSLPDNPCDLLTADELADVTGLKVTSVRRKPSIQKLVSAQLQGREPDPGMICSYETTSPFGAISIAVPPRSGRASGLYWEARSKYFETFPGSARPVEGLGMDAWLAGGGSLHVLVRENEYLMLSTQMYQRQSRELLVDIARSILRRNVQGA